MINKADRYQFQPWYVKLWSRKLMDILKDILMDILKDIKWWFYYRFHPSHRYNKVDTCLSPGYYDKDKLILHACFSLLVDFVEGELAWIKLISHQEERNKVPWYMTLERYRDKHARQLALQYLIYWDQYTPDDNHEQQEIDIHKAEDKEIRELYLWWMDIRPKRVDPFGVIKEEYSPDNAMDLDEAYNQEDEDMLIRLMKIRLHMWT
mgnify:CR=1 FL=1